MTDNETLKSDLEHLQGYTTMRMSAVQGLRDENKKMDDYYRGEMMILQEYAQIIDEKLKGMK